MPLPLAPNEMADTVKLATPKKTHTKKAPKETAALLKSALQKKENAIASLAKEKLQQKENKKTKKTVATKDETEVKAKLRERLAAPAKVSKKNTASASKRRKDAKPRLFVLDTNVLLHDPTSLFRFEEHDVFLPMTVLEELDNHKTGTTDVARNAREVSRWIDRLIEADPDELAKGCRLNSIGNKEATGRLFFQTKSVATNLDGMFLEAKADNAILFVVRALAEEMPDKDIVLVSKDINMRIKAAALGLNAEDYFNDKTIDDAELLYSGKIVLPEDFWETHGKNLASWQADGHTYYRITGPLVRKLQVNEFVHTADASFVAQVSEVKGEEATLRTIRDFTLARNALWGIHARNLEQSFALNLLTNPEIDLVTLLGHAGTGKTLMTLAAALSQTLDERRYSEIIFTRATVSVGEDIGYLPGTEEEKMTPWMGALEDNLEVLLKTDRSASGWRSSATNDIVKSRIRIKSMSFMRGRTFLNKFVIIDEAQNLSPKQMKTLVTRAGPGTKIVCLGNIAQIDTPYLTEGSSGLSYLIDRLKGWPHAGHITLERGERSRLAHWASETL